MIVLGNKGWSAIGRRLTAFEQPQTTADDLARNLGVSCRLVTYGLPFVMAIKVEEYVTGERKNHYGDWFNALPVEYASKVAAARARMMVGSLGNVKPIDGMLKEYRIDWGPGIRIYFIQDGDKLIILLGGGTKNGQTADIKQAKKLRDEYSARKVMSRKGQKG